MVRSSTLAPPRSVWSYLRAYRGNIAVGVVMLVATSSCALVIPKLLGDTIDALGTSHPEDTIPSLALAMIGCAIAQGLTRIVSRIAIFDAARKAEYDLRSQLFRHLLTLDSGFFSRSPTGDLMSRLTNDVQTVRSLWGPGVLNLVNTAFVFLATLALMIRIDPTLTLWAVMPYPSMMIFGQMFSRRMYNTSRAVSEQLAVMSSAIQEDLTGIGVIKSYALEPVREKHFVTASTKLLEHNMKFARIRGQLIPALMAMASLSVVISLWVGGRAVVRGDIGLGQLIQFNGYLALLVWPTLALGWMMSLLQRGGASWRRLQTLLETEPTICSPPTGRTQRDFRGDVEIRNLSYSIAGKPILRDVSLTIPAKTTTALVGRIGSGKSTLIEALPRLIDVPPGTVFLDGHDVTSFELDTLRSAVGYAPQEAFLFSRTIAQNVAFASNTDRLSEVDFTSAVKAAGLTSDLARLPRGADTIVGERGITLSGGQRQRVALARAIASDPAVLILDDSLSSVDAHTEKVILGHLEDATSRRTTLIISHRIAAVRKADQIVVLDQGRVVESGTHAELLDKRGLYAELYRDQLTEDVLSEKDAND